MDNSSPAAAVLDAVFRNLASRSELVRAEGVKQLKQLAEDELERAQDSVDENRVATVEIDCTARIMSGISSLIENSDEPHRLGAIAAMDMLVRLDQDMDATCFICFANHLNFMVRHEKESELVVIKAAEALGTLVKMDGNLSTDMVDDSISAAIEHLRRNGPDTIRRVASVHVLMQLSINAPTYFYVHVGDFLDVMWRGLCDSAKPVRLVTGTALHACLAMIGKRKLDLGMSDQCQQWYEGVYAQSIARLSKPTRELPGVHGALIVIGELLQESHARDTCIRGKLSQLVPLLVPCKEHKDRVIKRQYMSLLPSLHISESAHAPKLEETVRWLLNRLLKNDERAAAFDAVAELASTQPVLAASDQIFECVKASLKPLPNKKNQEPCVQEALRAVQMIVQAHGRQPQMVEELRVLLPSMFDGGLSASLEQVLAAIIQSVDESLHAEVQQSLLDSISKTLTGKPWRSMLSRTSRHSIHRAPSMDVRAAQASLSAMLATGDPDTTRLALSILASFKFNDYLSVQFVNATVVGYLDDENTLTRVGAALCCCKVLRHVQSLDSASTNARRQILERCLVLAAADPESSVRRQVLEAMNGDFDSFLAEDKNLRLVLVPLNDEDLEVRKIATALLGRLGRLNPSYIMPTFRKILVQLLTELEHNQVQSRKEEAAELLTTLIRNGQGMVQPYATPIAQSLIGKLEEKQVRARVAARMLETLGELVQMGAEQMQEHFEALLNIIIRSLQDQSSALRREIALRALRQLVSGTGNVIKPYLYRPALMNILRSTIKRESSLAVRDEAVSALGTLGAIDSHMLKLQELKRSRETDTVVDSESTIDRWSASHTGEEYCVSQTLTILIRTLNNSSLVQYHSATVMVLMFIVKNISRRIFEPFLPKVVPPFLRTIRSHEKAHRGPLLDKLTELVIFGKGLIDKYLSEIVELAVDCWSENKLLPNVVSLVQELSKHMPTAFKPYIPSMLPDMIGSLRFAWRELLNGVANETVEHCRYVLDAFVTFGSMLEDHLYLALPQILSIASHRGSTGSAVGQIKLQAVRTIGSLCAHIRMFEYTSRIVLPLVRTLESPDTSDLFRAEIVTTLNSLVLSVGYDYAIFVPAVEKALSQAQSSSASRNAEFVAALQKYNALVAKILASEFLSNTAYTGTTSRPTAIAEENEDQEEENRLPIDYDKLAQAWDTSQRSTTEDWIDWMWRFEIELLRQSPSPSLRNCEPLAQLYKHLAVELFQTAFLAIWNELYDLQQTELIYNLEVAFGSSSIPPQILQMLLNLAEFMEQFEKPLPIDIRTLAELAQRCQSFAKARHYWELVFTSNPEIAADQLITINTELQQPESAAGMLITMQKLQRNENTLEKEAAMYEKLHQWGNALRAYERRAAAEVNLCSSIASSLQATSATSSADVLLKKAKQPAMIMLKRMRCLKELGAWAEVSETAKTLMADTAERSSGIVTAVPDNTAAGRFARVVRHNVFPNVRQTIASTTAEQMAPYAATAAWNLGKWDDMLFHTDNTRADSEEGSFFRAVLAIHQKDWTCANLYIEKTRQHINQRLTEVASQTYARAYDVIFDVQKLTELQEVIEYHTASSQRKKVIRRMWDQRLLSCERRVEFWQHTLPIRALVISPQEDVKIRCKFAALCRKRGEHHLFSAAKECLAVVFGTHSDSLNLESITTFKQSEPTLIYAFLKLNWLIGEQKQATLVKLNEYLCTWSAHADSDLLAKCHRTAGKWRRTLDPSAFEAIISSYQHATTLAPHDHKAWHSWALMNYEVGTMQEERMGEPSSDDAGATSRGVVHHMNMALKGFFQSIQLPGQHNYGNALQDVLHLLTVWFRYGENAAVHETVEEGLRDVSVDTWLQVIPQIVARIDSPRQKVRAQIKNLLIRVGEAHPQALLFPLLVSTKSNILVRQTAAWEILNEIRKNARRLIEEAELVSRELDRIAVLWNEEWHAGLEEACKNFTNGNVDAMLEQLDKLHESLHRGPETLREISFQQSFGSQLCEAEEWINRYRQTRSRDDLHRAWNIYYVEFQKIAKTLGTNHIELQYVSERLLKAKCLDLVVPGTYRADRDEVCIASVDPLLQVLPSKQRPRKLAMIGSDGRTYEFLLKGKEDIRLDERVMQLFGLINKMLATDVVTSRRDLGITRYDVIPLSSTSGLIGWVGGCDTLNALIKGYREARNIKHHIEQKLLLECVPHNDMASYDKLTLAGKIEAFEWAQNNTAGNDLKRILWLSSRNSEDWLERQTMYTRSMAVMSMVGYVLGLGDRHPSNLMLHRQTGKIVHIDFGDCFEVAMNREKYPERVPFRLTRMLVKAFEVCGIEGIFRHTCEDCMKVMRREKDSLMAMLEAFVHDPLISWRLMPQQQTHSISRPSADRTAEAANLSPPRTETSKDTTASTGLGSSSLRRSISIGRLDEYTAMSMIYSVPDSHGAVNRTARGIVQRILRKLAGTDFSTQRETKSQTVHKAGQNSTGRQSPSTPSLSVEHQVRRLIREAQSNTNLCQHWHGWCAYW
eukprot:SAG31_NODE_768_length_12226_cov_3.928424_3_plen_2501_part_00